MSVHNSDIAAVFKELADLLEIAGENPFRVRAYRNATRTIDNLAHEAADLIKEEKDLTELGSIGKDLAKKIEEIVETGTARALEEIREKMPDGITDLLKIPGLGPKRVKVLYHELEVTNLQELDVAAKAGKVRELPGLGAKTEQQIIESIARRAATADRFNRSSVTVRAEELLEHLRGVAGVERLSLAGSYRRARDTVGDLDILAVASESTGVMAAFVAYDEVKEVLAHGATKSSVVLRSGIQVDLRVVEAGSYGAAMHYFTGSKAHNIAVRKLAQQQGLKVNEYGVYRGEEAIAGATEEEVFAAVGLPFIAPELREDRGELDAAGEGRLPDLVELGQIKGDLHAHTTASDGRHSVREMAEAGRERGYEYIGITDHSKRLTVANGLDEERLLHQIAEIDRVNAADPGIAVLKGLECDILEDGSLDLSDDVLERLDYVIGSVHSLFRLSREKQTERILRAMDHPCFTFLAHPTGRLILTREPYEVDMPRIIRHARERGCFLELNANPMRLDLNDTHCMLARETGVVVTINTDAHRIHDYDYMRYGIGQARRGWLEAKDVLNTRSLDELRAMGVL